MKRTAMNHTKLKRLCRELKIPVYQAAGILECLWHLTAREAPAGNIGKLADEDIASCLEWERPAAELTQGLVNSNWLDRHDQHRLIIHDWHEHSDDAIDNQLARAAKRYANGSIPRMTKLSKSERELLREKFAHEVPPRGTNAHDVRTECHEMPLPEPEPKPVPEPEPDPENLAPEMIAKAVQVEAGIFGERQLRTLTEVCTRERSLGVPSGAIRDGLCDAWSQYQSAAPRLAYTWAAEKFFGEGYWKNPPAWPWKDGQRPKPVAIHVNPLDEVRRQRACAEAEIEREKVAAAGGEYGAA